MRKFRNGLALGLALILMLSFGGCQKKVEAQLGQWTENTFTNSWFDITVTLPVGYQILEADEIRDLLGAGQEVIVNNGLLTKEEIAAADGKTLYDFYVFDTTATSSLALGYEEVPSSCTEEEYLEIVTGNLESLQSVDYEVGEPETATVGKHEYLKVSATLYSGLVLQDYYVCRQDGYMAFLIVTYNAETAVELQNLVTQIQ